jgi:Ca-activated chloride channel family protein
VEKFKALARILVEDAVLEFKQIEGIQLQDCFRLQPAAGPIKIGEALRLGPILHDMPLSVLFEFVIAPSASQTEAVTLLEGKLKMAAAARPAPFPVIPLRMACPVATTSSIAVPPASILNALSKLALYRLQERARQEAQAGEYEAANRHLRALALRLHAHGHHGLAKTALLEAENVGRLQQFSEEGSKEIKYGTRALMQPALEQPE